MKLAILLTIALMMSEAISAAGPMYTVKEGDTLWGIARRYGLSYGRLCEINGKPEGWSLVRPGQKIVAAQLLDDSDDISLFAGETEADFEHNCAVRKTGDEFGMLRDSLFMRRRTEAGTYEWRLLMTTGGDWKDAEGMNKWCKDIAEGQRSCFMVLSAKLAKDRHGIWMACNPYSFTYFIVCYFDLDRNTFKVLSDGDSINEQPDGTILIRNRKTYLEDKNGEPLGAAWYDEWRSRDGKVVRKTRPRQINEIE